MATEISICNLALARLGQRANVSSVNPPEGSAHAEILSIFLPVVRDALIADPKHAWSWATKRKQLAETDQAIYGFQYTYVLPADYVRALRVLPPDAGDDDQGVDYLIEDSKLHTNIETPMLVYVYKQSDPTKWSALFADAVADALAAAAGGSIVRGLDPRQKQVLTNNAAASLALARTADANAAGGSGAGTMKGLRARYVPGSVRARGTSNQIPDAPIIRS